MIEDGALRLQPDIAHWRGVDGTYRAERGRDEHRATPAEVAPRAEVGPRGAPLAKRDQCFVPSTFPQAWPRASEDKAED
eukprot:12831125-Alexandrium_andersonii.AAC.1